MSTLLSTIKANPAASGFMAGGGLLQGAGSLIGGLNQAASATNVADIYKEQAALDTFNAGTQVQANQEKGAATMSEAGAAAGAGGVTAGGSPTMAIQKTQADVSAADVYARYTGKIKSASDLYQAQLESYSAQQAKLGGIAGAGMSLFETGAAIATL